MKKIRTLLIEDSTLMRLLLTDILQEDPNIEIIGTAENGKKGVEMALELKPDVVVTDYVMPEYDGLYVVKQLMKSQPVPIILLSSLERTDPQIFDALSAGACDFIDKPKKKIIGNIRSVDKVLIESVHVAAKANIAHLTKKTTKHNQTQHVFEGKLNYDIIILGASTGGPGTIESILQNIPSNLAIPIVIAQHMPERFLESFAKRLNASSPLEIKIAENGDYLYGETIYILSGKSNTKIIRDPYTGKTMFSSSSKQYKEFNNPSVDCIMQSASEVYKNKCIGVLLTGMGKDGTLGLTAIKENGGYTIAQDEQSCVIFGMPKNAIDTGVVNRTVSLKDMAGFLISCL